MVKARTAHQQVIDGQIHRVVAAFNESQDDAFERFVFSLVTGKPEAEYRYPVKLSSDVDKGVDAFVIEEEDKAAEVYIIQSKNRDTLEERALNRLSGALTWTFSQSIENVEGMASEPFKQRIVDFRKVVSDKRPENTAIHVVYATTRRDALSHDIGFADEADAIVKTYGDLGYADFTLDIYGARELADLLYHKRDRDAAITTSIKIVYDANRPSILRHEASGVKGLICTAPAKEIARIVNSDPHRHVFEADLRKFLGAKGRVNREILHTCSTPIESQKFWFYNNGITIVCEDFNLPPFPQRDGKLELIGMQIVNGCQTASVIAEAAKNKTLDKNAMVLLRVYVTKDNELAKNIVLTTNSQTVIKSRDLHANDPEQKDMQEMFLAYGLSYERKAGEFAARTDISPDRIVSNETVGQAYMAVSMAAPSDARRRKGMMWDEYYTPVFASGTVEPRVISYLLYMRTLDWIDERAPKAKWDAVESKIARAGALHVAYAFGRLLRRTDEWDQPVSEHVRLINKLQSLSPAQRAVCTKAFNIVCSQIRAQPRYLGDIDQALRQKTLDKDIKKALTTK